MHTHAHLISMYDFSWWRQRNHYSVPNELQTICQCCVPLDILASSFFFVLHEEFHFYSWFVLMLQFHSFLLLLSTEMLFFHEYHILPLWIASTSFLKQKKEKKNLNCQMARLLVETQSLDMLLCKQLFFIFFFSSSWQYMITMKIFVIKMKISDNSFVYVMSQYKWNCSLQWVFLYQFFRLL